MKFLHTCIRVKDLEKSIEFYEMLGFKETNRKDYTDNGFVLVYLSDAEEKYELELTYNIGSEGYDLGNGYSHIAISYQDLEAKHQKHKELGYEVTDLKGLPGTIPSYYFIKDPDGYNVEVIREK
ncbi:MAG: VOC family protein [Mycoplasmatales bacterium]